MFTPKKGMCHENQRQGVRVNLWNRMGTFGLFALTWWIIAFDGSTHHVTLIGQVYRGYNISPLGSVVGLVYGFFDALIGGAITAWLYNRIAACCERKETNQTTQDKTGK